jgi:hypothetical protein
LVYLDIIREHMEACMDKLRSAGRIILWAIGRWLVASFVLVVAVRLLGFDDVLLETNDPHQKLLIIRNILLLCGALGVLGATIWWAVGKILEEQDPRLQFLRSRPTSTMSVQHRPSSTED